MRNGLNIIHHTGLFPAVAITRASDQLLLPNRMAALRHLEGWDKRGHHG